MDGGGYCHSPPSSPASVVTSGEPESGFYGVADPMPSYWSLKGSYRAIVGPSPPIGTTAVATATFGFFTDAISGEKPRHFLDSCFRCKNPLAGNRDIFMYRGDTPFCSVECRQEQIEIDEAEEKKTALKHQISMKHKDQQRRSSPSKSPKIRASAAGTVAAR